jgi:hypothetical protein
MVADGISSCTIICSIKDAVGTLLDGSASTSTAANNTITFNVSGPCNYQSNMRVQDAVNGTASILLRSTPGAGIIHVTATSFGLVTGTTEIIVLPGSASKIRVGAALAARDGIPWVADGNATLDLTATISDMNDNLVVSSTDSVTFNISGAGATWPDGSVIPQSIPCFGGIATIRIKSTTQAGAVIVSASCAGLASDTTSFITSAGSASKIIINRVGAALAARIADCNSITDLTVQIFDLNNNPVIDYSGQLMFSITGEAMWLDGTVSPRQVGISQGSTSVSLRSTARAGNITVTITADNLISATTGFCTIAGQPVKLGLMLDKQTLNADNSDETGITINLFDYNDNIVVAANTQNVQLTTEGGYGTIVTTSGALVSSVTVTAGNGPVTGLKLRAGTKSGVMKLTATSPGLTSSNRDVTFVPTMPVKVVLVASDKLSADGGTSSTTVMLYLADVNDNKVTSIDYPVQVNVDNYGFITTGNQPFMASVNSNTVNGELGLVFKSTTKSGIATVSARSAGLADGIVYIETLPQQPVKVMLTADNPALVADGINETVIRAAVLDVNDNVVTNDVVSMTFMIVSTQNAATWHDGSVEPCIITTNNGIATVKLKTAVKAGSVRIIASGNGLQQGEVVVNMLPGQAARFVLNNSCQEIKADNVSKTTVTVTVVDMFGNNIPDFSGELMMTTVGPVQESMKRIMLVGGTTDFTLTSISKTGPVKVKITNTILGTTEFMMIVSPGDPAKIQLYPYKTNIIAGMADSTIVSARITDVNNNLATVPADVKFEIAQDAGDENAFATWIDNSVSPQLVPCFNGIATIEVKSGTRVGAVVISGTLISNGNVELSSSSVGLVTIAQLDPRKIVIRLKQGSSGSIPADGISRTIIESVVTDVNGNLINTANNTVMFNIDGEGDIMADTQPVKTVYLNSDIGVAQVEIRSTKKAGFMTVVGSAMGLDGSSVTVVTQPGFAAKINLSVTELGSNKYKLNTVITDTNDNAVTGYNTKVMFRTVGPAVFETSTSAVPVNGTIESIVRTGVEVGTITITAKSGTLSSTVNLFTAASAQKKLFMTVSPQVLYSMETATVTIVVMDEYNNLVQVVNPVRIKLTAESGMFSDKTVLGSDYIWGTSPYYFTLQANTAYVLYKSIKSGTYKISCETDGLTGWEDYMTVTASTIPANIVVNVSSFCYVPSNVNIGLSMVDVNDNRISRPDKYVTVVATNSFGEVVLSTTIKINSDVVYVKVYMEQPCLLTVKCVYDRIHEKQVKTAVLFNRTIDTVIRSTSPAGNIKLLIPKNTVDADMMIEIKKLAGDKIELIARDNVGNVMSGPINFNPGKYAVLSLPYLDIDQNGVVDGTIINEQNLHVAKLENGLWKVMSSIKQAGINTQILDTDTGMNVVFGVDNNQNVVSAQINEMGTYKLMGVGTDPTIENLVVYPNPFSSQGARFMFNVGSECEIKVNIYSVTGRLVNTLTKYVTVNDAGNVEVVYDGTDNQGQLIANSTYIYKIVTKNGSKTHTKTGKLTKIK